jgi:hypothetical protein
MNFDVKYLLLVRLIRYSAFVRQWRKDCEYMYNGKIHQLSIDFLQAYDSVRREVLHNILVEFLNLLN